MGKISLLELAAVLSKRYGLNKKEATSFVSQMFDIIQQSLEQEKLVKIKGLGTFKIIDVDARESVNVNTGERVLIEGHNKITFTPDTLMKELVNKPFSQFETVVLNEGVDFEDAAANESLVSDSESDNDPDVLVVSEPEPIVSEPESVVSESIEPAAMPLVDFVDHAEEEEDIPEWVIEPYKPEPEPEPEPESEPEPVDLEEHEEEPEPEPEEESKEEPEEEEVYEEEDEEETTSGGKKWWLALLALLIGLAGGYVLGNYVPFSALQSLTQQEVSKPEEPKEAPATKPLIEETIDSVVTEEPVVEEPQAEAPKAEEPKAEPIKKEAPKAEAPKTVTPAEKPVALDQYQQKDSRVRTGAWRIVGTAQVYKVKEGETLKLISRRFLGPDMDCYIEVYNNLTADSPLKAGQEIKIPQLKHKNAK